MEICTSIFTYSNVEHNHVYDLNLFLNPDTGRHVFRPLSSDSDTLDWETLRGEYDDYLFTEPHPYPNSFPNKNSEFGQNQE